MGESKRGLIEWAERDGTITSAWAKPLGIHFGPSAWWPGDGWLLTFWHEEKRRYWQVALEAMVRFTPAWKLEPPPNPPVDKEEFRAIARTVDPNFSDERFEGQWRDIQRRRGLPTS